MRQSKGDGDGNIGGIVMNWRLIEVPAG
jgi:hypothetical protein